jgi:hypothetical protein
MDDDDDDDGDDDAAAGAAPPKPLRPELAALVRRLLDLRNALEETSLALSDYQCTLDSDDRRAAELETQQAIERAKLWDYSAGSGS